MKLKQKIKRFLWRHSKKYKLYSIFKEDSGAPKEDNFEVTSGNIDFFIDGSWTSGTEDGLWRDNVLPKNEEAEKQ